MNGYPSTNHTYGPLSSAPPQTSTTYETTFAFRKRWGQIDWRNLASVDVDKIAREMDFQSLQQNIMNVTFCNIESEEFRNVDHNFIKLFRLAQLIIEYLLHCQQYLSEQGTGFEQRAKEIEQELEKTKTELSTVTTELKTVKKENKKRKKIVQAYQDMLNAGATGIHSCPVCKREFVSKEYLQSHIHRRHPDSSLAGAKNGEAKSNVLSQEELEKKLMEQMTERLQATEAQLKEEMHTKELAVQQKQVNEFEQWKAKEQEKMKLELQAFKEPILSELRSAQQEKADLEQVLLQKQAEIEALSAKKLSHLGHLEGAQELDIDGSRRKQAELEEVKRQLEQKVDELQLSMKKQEKSWQKRLQKLSTSYQDQIDNSAKKLSFLEQSLQESTISREKDKSQSLLKEQLSLLKKKMKKQEEQLHSHRQEISILQTRESTPTPPPSSPIHVSEYPPHPDHTTQVQVHTDTEETVPESESGEEEVDGAEQYYTPLPNRPMIKTLFPHSPEVLTSIKRETEHILLEGLQQRGLPKGVTGLSNDNFALKMKSLEQERQPRVQNSYNFVEHRDRAVRQIDEVARDFLRSLPKQSRRQKESKNKKSTAKSTDLAVSLPGVNKSKPPLPTPSRLSASQPDPARTSGSSVPKAPQIVHKSPAHEVTSLTKVEPLSSESDSDSLTALTPSPPPSSKQLLPQPISTTEGHQEDSPWDSEDDSIELLAAPSPGGRTSSTPIKSASRATKQSDPSRIITIEPNPSKRPSGGIPVFQIPSTSSPQNDDDDNSFDISEPSIPAIPTTSEKGSKLKSSLPGKESVNPISHTATSRSALTTISVEDFGDSDFSDLDL